MAVNDVYRLSVDYTLATQVTSPVSGKTAFVPAVQFYSGGTAFDVSITSPLGTKTIAQSVAVTPATSSLWGVQGSVAHDDVDSGNPVKIGFRAASTAPAAVVLGDRVNGWAGLNGQAAVMLADATGALMVIQGLGDAQTNGVNTYAVSGRNSVYNGTQWDRTRSGAAAAALNTGIGSTSVEEVGRTYAHISTATTTTVKSGAGHLHTVSINSKGTVASAITIYDNTAGSGTVIAVLDSLNLSGTFIYDLAFSTGLTFVTTGTVAPDITVTYR